MPLEQSPSFDEISQQELQPQKPGKKTSPVRFVLIIITLVILALLAATIAQNGLPAALRGRGTVSGSAIDEAGKTIPVEVLVFDTNIQVQSDDNGTFYIEGVPAGKQSIIVAYDRIATEVVVDIKPNVENPLGTITVPTSLIDLAK